MFEKRKADKQFNKLLKRPDINKAYAMVKPSDSWYDTITKVHHSLAEIQKLPHEILEITSHDNLKLKAVYYQGNKNSNLTVICVHGFTSHAEREWAFPGLFYLSLGYNVLIPYQRAHGLSEGKYITVGALEYKDMIGWVNKINYLNPDDSIIIHGLSMGGGIALELSDKDMKNVKGIISDAPNVSIKDMFKEISKYIYKKNADVIADYIISRFENEFNVDINNFECIDIVANSKYPILLSAGSMENMENVFADIKNANPNKTDIIILPGCNHGNGMYKQTEMYQKAIKEFINSVL